MARNNEGIFNLYTPGNPVVFGTIIDPDWANPTLEDIAAALSDSLSRSGKGGMQATLAMGGKKISGLGGATLEGDAPTAVQVRNNAFSWLTGVATDPGGNAYTGNALLNLAVPVAGTTFLFLVTAANTGAMTLSVSGGAVLPILYGGMATPANLVAAGTVLAVVFVNNTYRIVGGTAVSSGGLDGATTDDPQTLSVVLASNALNVTAITNVPNGLPKLSSSGLLRPDQMPTLPLTLVGLWDASGGVNPAGGTASGQLYLITVPGNLTIFRAAVAPNFTAQVTAVVEGDGLLWNNVNTVAQPTGWYFLPRDTAVVASAVTIVATPSFPGVVDLQSWLDAVDPFYLPVAGGTVTGTIEAATPPATANSLTNKQYVDDAVAAVDPGVTTFNTRTGAVTLLNTDVTAALGYTPANKAGETFTGNVVAPKVTAAGFVQSTYSATRSGTTNVDFNDGQSQVLTLTGNYAPTAIVNVPAGTILRVTLILGAFNVTAWPAAVHWPGGSAPSLIAGADKRAIVVFENDGTFLLANASVY